MKTLVELTLKLIIALIFSFSLNAAEVKEIIIKGNSRVSSETILVYCGINKKVNMDAGRINEILRSLYSTNFFENVEVRETNGLLEIIVEEYPVVNQLVIEGEPSNRIKEKIQELITTKTKQSFIKSSISKDVNLIKNLYSSIGFNFADVDVKIKEVDKKNFDVLFKIDKGEITKFHQ